MVTSTQSIRNLSNVEFISSSPYFAGLDSYLLERIRRLMVERRVEKHEIIWLEQDPANTEMHQYIALVADLSLRRVNGRLARMLLGHSNENVFDDSLILSRGDMAAMAGTVREVIGRSLKALEEKGIIISNSRRIIIRDSDALRIMAGLV